VFGLTRPRKNIIGMDISGEIELVGQNVKLFKKGDQVYGTAGGRLGANAEYISLPERSAIVKKPSNINHHQAASIIFGGMTAIYFLRDQLNIRKGQDVLVNGASGSTGTVLIQLAVYFGATVTAVCSSVNVELVTKLGAKKVIDYTKEGLTTDNKTYDVILDAVGNLSLPQCKKVMNKQGKLVLLNTDLLTNLLSLFRKSVICGVAAENKERLNFLRNCIESGHITPIIDKIYPLKNTADAHRYVDTGRKKGNVVIAVTH
jgi:NADPH:quinone reductase-like Zn-dependent oxidoreductase